MLAGVVAIRARVLSGALALLALVCAGAVVVSGVRTPPTRALDTVLLAFDLLPLTAALLTGWLLLRAPRHPGFTAYLAFALVLFVLGTTHLAERAVTALSGPPRLLDAFTVLSCFGFLVVAYLFPDGRFVPGWSRWLIAGWGAAAALALAFPWDTFPPAAQVLLGVLTTPLLLTLVGTQVHRYRAVSTPLERQQTTWFLLALTLQVTWYLAVVALPVHTIEALPAAGRTAVAACGALVTTSLCVAIGGAVLRHRLFDVDLVVGRALVYGALTAFTALSCAVVIGAAGLVQPADTPAALVVAATAVTALGMGPLRRAVQRRVNRWLYGLRDEPAAALGRLGEELSATSDLDGAMSRIASTVRSALRSPRVRVQVFPEGAPPREATAGAPATALDQAATVDIRSDGALLGRIDVAPRPWDRVSPRDLALVQRLARHAAVAIRAGIVTEELQRSRAELILTREEERHRLHRDLHDGLGPTLASLSQRIDLALRSLASDPARTRHLLDGAREGIDEALAELHVVVESLRPAALDRLGLVGAIAAAWSCDERVRVDGFTLPPLDPQVEQAAYRIAMEAVSNAVRHADATRCDVTVSLDHEDDGDGDGVLVLEIVDDGHGMPACPVPGAGLRTMRERTAELGGKLTTDSDRTGVRIVARLPVTGGAA
ncbi:Histidine kinase-, DNA gyrase B-, and HSP90-like ATPase [Quadrisphaera granulorum]|uniref:histidine kinase n=1 Tax=Quadrisphaera granulorum TaxID=317664 RepID=A0A315ZX67_9ACTN|nr:sensor histidine kinase [Quadrisphaera granulorum]PWJ49873.1 histidine kinase/DNA gyrase B/HSP90-like ATPase [Quadrisphaera granulorum]SZE98081.1 Histidine kinase-, DNA gyrase B-, and HSP90-like ATPase [Quadrisphaera granulorum]